MGIVYNKKGYISETKWNQSIIQRSVVKETTPRLKKQNIQFLKSLGLRLRGGG